MMLETGILSGKQYLCVETSSTQGFIALYTNNEEEKIVSWEAQHSEGLPQSLKSFQKDFSNIQFLAVNYGPGRFTGIRLGVNFVKTLAYYLSCSIYPISSLRMIAQPYLEQSDLPILSVMEAFAEKFYIGIYQKKNQKIHMLLEPQAIQKNKIEQYIKEPTIVVGNLKDLSCLISKKVQPLVEFYLIDKILPSHFSSAVLADFHTKDLKKWDQVEPLYIRVPGVLQNSR